MSEPSLVASFAVRPGVLPSTIWLVCAWSAVTITSVLPSLRAKSRAFETASSICSVSPIWPHASAAWSFLSIEALSTCRKNPFLLPAEFLESRSIALPVIDLRSGTWLNVGSGVHFWAEPRAPPGVATSGANRTGRLPGANSPSSGLF